MQVAIRNAILPLIQRAQRIILIAHVAPDGDCIGSLLALGHALRILSKQTALVCADPLPSQYEFLPGFELVTRDASAEFQLLISVDCSDIQRMGPVYRPAAFAYVPLINIDHHLTNVQFGTVNWVDTTAAATAEMIYDLIEEMAVPITKVIAMCLLTGIVTDTRGFRTATTTMQTMSIATRLMGAGASLNQITERVLNRRPLSEIWLWREVLRTAQTNRRIIWAQVTREMRERAGAGSGEDPSGLANFLVSAHEADVAVLFSEQPTGRVEVAFRSVPGVDVSKLAFQLGGGGHPQAAGCTLIGTLSEVRSQVLSALGGALARQGGTRRRQEPMLSDHG